MEEYKAGGVSGLLQNSCIASDSASKIALGNTSASKRLKKILKERPIERVEPLEESSAENVAFIKKQAEFCPALPTGDGSDESDAEMGQRAQQRARRQLGRRKEDIAANHQRTVFVGNVSTKVDRKRLTQLFKKYGPIESVRFRSVMREDITLPKKAAVITKGFHEKCQSINAYVVFIDASCARAALASNGEKLEGLHLRVDATTPDVKHDNRRSVFIGNIPFDASEEEVRAHFKSIGDIEYIRLIKDPKTRIGRGFGYVQFKTSDSAALALRLHEQPFRGRNMRVLRCVKKEKVKPAVSSSSAAQRRLSLKQGQTATLPSKRKSDHCESQQRHKSRKTKSVLAAQGHKAPDKRRGGRTKGKKTKGSSGQKGKRGL